MAIEKPIATFGRSLLTEESLEQSGALSKQGNNYVWFDEKGWFSFDSTSGELRDKLEHVDYSDIEQVLSWNKLRLQYVNSLLHANSWVDFE